jgi:UPF0755 protein
MRRAALAVAAMGLVVGVAGVLWLEAGARRPMAAPGAPTIIVEIPSGTAASRVGALLEDRGLIRDKASWRWHLLRRRGLAAKAGRHELSPSMSLAEIATRLEQSPLPEDVPFVVLEGWRLVDTDTALTAAGLIQAGAYVAAASKPEDFRAPFSLPRQTLEGYLYPETYRIVPTGFDVKALIQRQLETFTEKFFLPHAAELAKSGRTLHDVVVMASMLEREEPSPAQRPVVAGILWKRIDRGFPLGVDATSRYELPQWNDREAFLKRLRDRTDPWNSRHRKGLPPGPIGAPTLESLIAALTPEKSDYWYYLHDDKRQLHPSKNAEEHEALRRQYNVY